MHRRSSALRSQAFTIVELIIVVAVIGILATVSIVGYGAIQANARDKAVLSDIEGVASEVTRYGTNNGGTYGPAVEWYSEEEPNANIEFTPSGGNVIDVVASDSQYCVRAYNNQGSSYSSIYKVAMKESVPGACEGLLPSTTAVNESPTVDAPPTFATVSTFAGSGTAGYADGVGTAAQFRYPYHGAFDSSGNLIIADRENHRIRKITSSGVVSTFAGSGTAGYADGVGTAAQFWYPDGVVIDTAGNLFVSDSYNYCIRKITPNATVSSFAGLCTTAGFADGIGSAARFDEVSGLAIDVNNNIFVADRYQSRIRKVTSSALVSTIAGNGNYGYVNGAGTVAEFREPSGLAVDLAGYVYVADGDNHVIRMIAPNGIVSTIAGTQGTQGFVNGLTSSAQFKYPRGVIMGGTGSLYVVDTNNSAIRKLNK